MYGDNQSAWPQTAPINVFVPERQRPKRIGFASKFVFVNAVCALSTGLMAFLNFEPEELGAIGAIPAPAMVGVGMVFALWLLVLIRPLAKGSRWGLLAARWAAATAMIVYSVYFVLGAPWILPEVFGGEPVLSVFMSAFTALLALVLFGCLWGRGVREYFRLSQPQPVPGEARPIGSEADWTPKQRPMHGHNPPEAPRS